MRFSLKKTLSLLHFPRRTKSESSMMITPKEPQPIEPLLFQSTSLPIIQRVPKGVEVTNLTIGRATTAFHSAHLNPSKAGLLNPDLDDAATVKERLHKLEADKRELSDQISALLVIASIHKQNCAQLQEDILYEKGVSPPQRKVEGGQNVDHANRVAQLERFVSAMIDLGLHIPVLDKAYKAVLNGEMADDALVDAIKEAAARPGTAWARIMPAIVGPRAPENYVSAINLTLKCRRELKQTKKVLRFWKKKAMSLPANQDLVTPSASALSDVVEEFNRERQSAMRNLLRRRGRLDSRIPLRTIVSISVDTLSSTPSSNSCSDCVSDITERPNETLEDRLDCNTVSSRSALPPLASRVFREELLASHSSKTFNFGRSILSNMGLNRLGHRQDNSASTISSASSANISEKRHGVVLAHSSQSILALSEWKLPEGELISLSSTVNLEYAQDTPFFSRQTSDNIFPANANPGVYPGEKRRSVEESIASLTRICAAFGDDDSGSSPSASESSDGEVHWRSFESGPRTVTTVSHDPGLLHIEQVHEIHPSQSPEHQSSSPKVSAGSTKSMLPVLKGLGRLSMSISPTKKKVVRPGLPIDRPTASSASKATGTVEGKTAAVLKRARQNSGVQPRSASLLPSSVSQRAAPRIASLTAASSRVPNHRFMASGKKAVHSISRILS